MKDPSNWVFDKRDTEQGTYDAKKHIKQRSKRGFSDYDWWNFSSYLSFVIIGGLEEFRRNGKGYPGGMSYAEWLVALDKMIAGFKAQEKMVSLKGFKPGKDYVISYDEWAKPLLEAWDEGSALFIEHYGALWD